VLREVRKVFRYGFVGRAFRAEESGATMRFFAIPYAEKLGDSARGEMARTLPQGLSMPGSWSGAPIIVTRCCQKRNAEGADLIVHCRRGPRRQPSLSHATPILRCKWIEADLQRHSCLQTSNCCAGR